MNGLFEYRSKLDHLHFTSGQKASLTAKVRDAAGKETPARRPLRRTAILAVTAAVALTSGGAVFATGQAGKLFAPVFGTSQTEIVNKIGHPIGAEATDDGITVTADAVIGDKHNACIIYTVKRTDGSPLGLPKGLPTEYLSFEQSDCGLHGSEGSHGVAWFTDGDDGSVRYVETVSADGTMKAGRASAKFSKLRYYDPDTKKAVTLSDGNWKLSFQADYEDSSLTLPAGEDFTVDGRDFTITEINISPVAIYVQYKTDGRVDLRTDAADGREPWETARCLDDVSIVLKKKDGSILDLTKLGGSINPAEKETVCTKSGVYREIIPIEDIESISVGGTDIAVPSD